MDTKVYKKSTAT